MTRYAAELHAHTTCSDGWLRPEALPAVAKQKGIDIIAVTDHDILEGGLRAKAARRNGDAYVIPGIEISVQGFHVLGYFIQKLVKSKTMQEVAEEIKDQDGICVLAHPVHYPLWGRLRKKPAKVPCMDDLKIFDAIEVYNSRNSAKANCKIRNICEENKISNLVVGSDAHFSFEIGSAKTFFELSELSDVEIKTALRSGQIKISNNWKSNRLFYYITGVMNLLRGRICRIFIHLFTSPCMNVHMAIIGDMKKRKVRKT